MVKIILKYCLGCFLVFTLVACSSEEEPEVTSYEYFDHIDHWDDLDDIGTDFTIIYYYSPFCDICISLKDRVTGYLKTLESEYTIYLIDEGMIYEQGEPPFETRGVPALFIYDDGTFQKMINGSKPVVNYLSDRVENQ
jgi:hypothetical protein